MTTTTNDEQRQAIFRAIIEAQDAGTLVAQSRTEAARQFGVTVEDVKAIEREGIEKQWPPL
ncbi:hypothetical protein [Limnoglobus roseus]|uniref:Uncharacterized protein n=1 Tax=Limnoglobus roseus TaxID=2598579 RepID=A0A5C1AH71_9BACT|nr:hypothetical protein [Limnoglobus roseus]QEL18160.1 hypothetical protein PX52LOC_05174 [Limnoglobus roseus]